MQPETPAESNCHKSDSKADGHFKNGSKRLNILRGGPRSWPRSWSRSWSRYWDASWNKTGCHVRGWYILADCERKARKQGWMMTVTENINLCKIANKKSYYFNLTRNEHSLAGAFYQTRSPLGSPCRTSEINWIVKSELSNDMKLELSHRMFPV